jgi:hypothetical protein
MSLSNESNDDLHLKEIIEVYPLYNLISFQINPKLKGHYQRSKGSYGSNSTFS